MPRWNNHITYRWEIYWNGASGKHCEINDDREFFVDSFKIYNDIEEPKTVWIVGERWSVPTGEPFQTFIGMCYEKEKHQVRMLTFDSHEEAESFIHILVEVLRFESENELCTMLSHYVCVKLLQANPKKIKLLCEEGRAYEEALAKKKAEERKNAKRLALIKKRASQKEARNNNRQPAHVYIFSFDERFCKIGIAHNVEARRMTKISDTGRMIVQWAYSELYPRERAEEVEQLCHAHFNKSRTYGEFFTVTFDEACVYLQSQVAKPITICREERK